MSCYGHLPFTVHSVPGKRCRSIVSEYLSFVNTQKHHIMFPISQKGTIYGVFQVLKFFILLKRIRRFIAFMPNSKVSSQKAHSRIYLHNFRINFLRHSGLHSDSLICVFFRDQLAILTYKLNLSCFAIWEKALYINLFFCQKLFQ